MYEARVAWVSCTATKSDVGGCGGAFFDSVLAKTLFVSRHHCLYLLSSTCSVPASQLYKLYTMQAIEWTPDKVVTDGKKECREYNDFKWLKYLGIPTTFEQSSEGAGLAEPDKLVLQRVRNRPLKPFPASNY